MTLGQIPDFALGTLTTFISAKLTGHMLARLSDNNRVRTGGAMILYLIVSTVVGLVIGAYTFFTQTSRHRRRILKKIKKFK